MSNQHHIYIGLALIVLAIVIGVIAFIVADVSKGYDAWFWILLALAIVIGIGAIAYVGYGIYASRNENLGSEKEEK